jgi:hypothetical protein
MSGAEMSNAAWALARDLAVGSIVIYAAVYGLMLITGKGTRRVRRVLAQPLSLGTFSRVTEARRTLPEGRLQLDLHLARPPAEGAVTAKASRFYRAARRF